MNLETKMFVLFFVLLGEKALLGTPQLNDYIVFEGDEYEILNIAPIEDVYGDEIGKFFLFPDFLISSLWRGILIKWEIKEEKLVVQKVQGFRDGLRVTPSDLYQTDENFANWFSGELKLGYSHCKSSEPINVLSLVIKNGVLLERLPNLLSAIASHECIKRTFESTVEGLEETNEFRKEMKLRNENNTDPPPEFIDVPPPPPEPIQRHEKYSNQ